MLGGGCILLLSRSRSFGSSSILFFAMARALSMTLSPLRALRMSGIGIGNGSAIIKQVVETQRLAFISILHKVLQIDHIVRG